MLQPKKMTIQEKVKTQKVLFDGAFGTYYAQVYDTKELPGLQTPNIRNECARFMRNT